MGDPVGPGALTALLKELAAGPRERAGWGRPLRPGETVGRFEILREIGRGGFGVVYEARDRVLQRPVAFKALRPMAWNAGSIEDEREALAEAEAAAHLSHPNIVQLHDAQLAPEGPFLILELLSGRTLGERLRDGVLPLDEALDVAIQVARGLAFAHAAGVVHRDLKPSNVFVCGDGQVKVLDFGLAAVLGRDASSGGTPGYMAPEQRLGAPGAPPADVYALGVVLGEMLTGRRPGADGSPPHPGGGSGLPPALVALVTRMLDPDPAARPADGGAALSALASIQESLRPRKRPWLAWSLAAAALAAALAAIAWPRPPPLPPGRLTVALADTSNETGNAQLDGAADLLRQALEQSPRVSILPRVPLERALEAGKPQPGTAIDEAAAIRAARALRAHVVLALSVRPTGAGLDLEVRGTDVEHDRPLFQYREATGGPGGVPDALDRLSDRIRRGLSESPESVADGPVRLAQVMPPDPEAWARYQEGRRLAGQGLGAQARNRYREAIALDPEFPLPHAELARFAEFSSREETEAHLAAALRHPERVPPRERRLVEATAAVVRWDNPRAIERYDEVIARWPDDPEAYAGASEILSGRWGTWAMSRPYDERLVALARLTPMDEAAALVRLGRLDEALVRARSLAAEAPGRPSSTLLSWVHRLRGEAAEALGAARDAMRRSRAPPSEILLWSFVEADALDELEEALVAFPGQRYQALALRGRWKEVMPSFDSTHSPESMGEKIFDVRADLSLGLRDLAHLRGDVVDLFRAGAGWVVCHAGSLADLGDLEGADRLNRILPMLDAREGCNVYYRTVRALRRGDPEEALRLSSGFHFANISYHRGHAQLAAGRPAEAVKEFREYRRNPNWVDGTVTGLFLYPQSLYWEAVALDRMGDRDGARTALDRLLRMWSRADPGLAPLRDAHALRARLDAPP